MLSAASGSHGLVCCLLCKTEKKQGQQVSSSGKVLKLTSIIGRGTAGHNGLDHGCACNEAFRSICLVFKQEKQVESRYYQGYFLEHLSSGGIYPDGKVDFKGWESGGCKWFSFKVAHWKLPHADIYMHANAALMPGNTVSATA